jgi:uncharacterized protein YndB with AHSA1/START domain
MTWMKNEKSPALKFKDTIKRFTNDPWNRWIKSSPTQPRSTFDGPRKNEMTHELIVVKSVEISTSPDHIWRAVTEPDKIAQWMGGAHVESQWEIGSDITFTGTMPNFNKAYRDRGTVLAMEREKFLQYSHWSKMSRLPDSPQNRTIITFILDGTGERTRLTVRHEHFESPDAYKHANFFWGIALSRLKALLEE